MRRVVRNGCLAVLLAMAAARVDATTYYVSVGGDDGSSGTSIDAPFQTPQHCADVAVSGDTCVFRGGVFQGAGPIMATTRSGTPGNPITFKAYGSEAPVFRVTSRSGSGYVVHVSAHNWIVLDGLRIIGGDYGIVLDDGASHSQVLDSDVSRGRFGGIRMGARASNNLIKGNRLVDNNRINWPRGSAESGRWGAALSLEEGSDGNLVEGNAVFWNHGQGLAIGVARNNIVRRNLLADNWDRNLSFGAGENVADANVIYVSEAARALAGGEEENRNDADGIVISLDSGAGSVASNVQVINNVVVNARSCVRASSGASKAAFRGWTLSNNTCVGNDRGVTLVNTGAGISNLTFQNNIVSSRSDGPLVEIRPAAAASRLRNNIYNGAAPGGFLWADGNPQPFESWAKVARDTRSSFADPLLVNAAAVPPRLWDDPDLGPGSPIGDLSLRDYLPSPSSPAIDAGVDFRGSLGLTHRGTHRDVGALEFCELDGKDAADPGSKQLPCAPDSMLPSTRQTR